MKVSGPEVVGWSYEELFDKIDLIDNKDELATELEILSKRAGMMAAYVTERWGHGTGDQGHDKALKELNRVGKILWVKAFGYNAYLPLGF